MPLEVAPPELVPPPVLIPPDEELVPPVFPALDPAALAATPLVPAEVPTPPEDEAPVSGLGPPVIWRQQPPREATATPIRRRPTAALLAEASIVRLMAATIEDGIVAGVAAGVHTAAHAAGA